LGHKASKLRRDAMAPSKSALTGLAALTARSRSSGL
jgi:hypothetical protein